MLTVKKVLSSSFKKITVFIFFLSLSFTGYCKIWIINNSGTNFVPANITINLGDTVTWSIQNAHDAVEVTQATWDANLNTPMAGGFRTPFGGGTVYPNQLGAGTHWYVCEPHAANGMKGIITVQSCSVPNQPGTISGNATVCPGGSTNYSITSVPGATSYTWTLPGEWTGTSTTNSISVIPGLTSGSISVTANNACGASIPQTKAITVTTIPAKPGTISGNQQACLGSFYTYSINAVPGAASYTWILPPGWTGSSTSNSVNATAGSNSGNILVTANNNCGSSSAQTLAIIVSTAIPVTPGSITGVTSVCGGSLNTYRVPAVAGATSYIWSLPSGWSGGSTVDSILAVAGISGGNISVTASNACGTSSAKTLAVVVAGGFAPSQPGTISGNSIVCAGTLNTYSISPVANATSYSWALPSGWSGTSTSTSIDATASISSGNITVTANNACGSSALQTKAITTNSIPATPATITGIATLCYKSGTTFSIASVPGATSYSWTLPQGWSGTSVTNIINIIAGNTGGNISVTANNACGSSGVQFKAVSVTTVDVTVTQAGKSLSSNATAATHQWINCDNKLSVANATSQTFSAVFNAGYSVVVTKNGCVDTSSCYNVTTAIPYKLIPIPDTLSGPDINLTMVNNTYQFYNGFNTTTMAYNGAYLGPTLILTRGQKVNMHVTNNINDTTTLHWHGLHVAPKNDGGPHTTILSGNTWNPSFTVMDNAATYLYHPHQMEKTMSQVIMGAAGMIIVRDTVEAKLTLPRTYGIDDIPLVCQFKHIDTITKQVVMDDRFDNIFMVNGALNPMVNVPAQVVRLRILNASSSRVLQFGFNDGRTFYQVASDDGLLNQKVPLTRLQLASAERAEILVDFSGENGKTFYINQYGNELPAGFPGGPAMMDGEIGTYDNITFSFLRINVIGPTASPVTTMPATLTTNHVWDTTGAYSLNFFLQGNPSTSMTDFTINGQYFDMDVVNFTRQLGDVMVWKITNQSMMAHPFHIHGGHFYILSIDGKTPPANLQGRKDVVMVAPIEGTAVVAMKFEDFYDTMIPYMYHCHILSHEDGGMMQQYIVKPPSTPNTWVGTISTAWQTAGNWSWGVVPNEDNDVLIAAGTPYSPVINSGDIADCSKLTLTTGAVLTVKTGALLNIKHQ